MENLAVKHDIPSTWLGLGCILERGPDRWLVETEFGRIPADRADGCLVEPEVGDRVLVVLAGETEAYILNVLKRASAEASIPLTLEGNARLRVRGDLDLLAEKVNVGAARDLQVKTKTWDMSFMRGNAKFGDLSIKGGLVSSRFDTVKAAARRIETVAERIIERCKRQYRRVDEFEEARVGRLRFWVKDLFSIQAKSTAIKSKEQVKVNADKILLG